MTLLQARRPSSRYAVGPAVVFAGGGTGGHIAPGIALAERLAAERPAGRTLFLGSGRRAEAKMFGASGFECRAIPSAAPGISPRKLARFVGSHVRGTLAARRVLADFGAEIVVGLGGYSSVPGVLAAAWAGLPVVLLEQNAVPGRANRFLARFAREVHCQWISAWEAFADRVAVRIFGSPVRARIERGNPADARRRLGLSPGVTTLLVVGGSQGAGALNAAVVADLPLLSRYAGRLQIVHITGERDFRTVKGANTAESLSRFIVPFLSRIELAYQAADLALCRAGATTIAEISAIGLPACLVPYPRAAGDHQTANARLYSERGAALVVREEELVLGRIARLVEEVAFDRDRLARMSRAAERFFPEGSAEASLGRIRELARRGKPRRRPA